jgi:hypothetical protein
MDLKIRSEGLRGESAKKDSKYRSKSLRAFSIEFGRYTLTAFMIYLLEKSFVLRETEPDGFRETRIH